jgi:hypothetical protein
MGAGGALYLIDQPLELKSSKLVRNFVHSSSEYFSDSAPLGGAIWYSSRYVTRYLSVLLTFVLIAYYYFSQRFIGGVDQQLQFFGKPGTQRMGRSYIRG